jgi:hypothetical protein
MKKQTHAMSCLLKLAAVLPCLLPCRALQLAPAITEMRPFKLSTDIRGEWDSRVTPCFAKLPTEVQQELQAEQERAALRARLAASADNFRRVQEAGKGAEAPTKKAPQVGGHGGLAFCWEAVWPHARAAASCCARLHCGRSARRPQATTAGVASFNNL